ncbi:MAG: 50S ribosomal protein L3 [Bdellovibrionaceae bacterium]|nr:50S ribosomal protein L3 [Pseudobdellovibrionaceae bacterium]
MSSVYDEQGKRIPVTVLKYDPLVVSQVKSKDKEGYAAVQVASKERTLASTNKACEGHFKKSGFQRGAKWSREIRQSLPDGVTVGQKVSISSLSKGDTVKMTGRSKGRGFSGVVKRWGFAGGPASHGSRFQRGTGSIGQCTFPGRVMKGRKMPGRYGFETITRNTQVVDVLPEQNAILLKGAVPGSVNSLIQLMKV